MTKQELKDEYNKLKDNVFSMLVSTDDQELRAMYSFATDRLETIFFARHKEIIVEEIKKATIKIAKDYSNSWFGLNGGFVYADTDSIKVKEDKNERSDR